jgi:hypothetical protein
MAERYSCADAGCAATDFTAIAGGIIVAIQERHTADIFSLSWRSF